jgi:hypothetical protein
MLLRRRPRARQVHVSLPRGRQLEITVPKGFWTRTPPRSRWTRPQTIATAIAGLGAAMAYVTSLVWRRRSAAEAQPTPVTTPATDAGTGRPIPAVSPAAQPPTSDREPDEIDRLARLDPSGRGNTRH